MIAWLAIAACAGSFVVDETPEAVEAHHAEAVKRTLAGLPWVARGIARPALQKAVWSCGRLEVARNETDLTVTCDDKDPVSVPLDGTPVQGTSPTGMAYQVRFEPRGDDIGLRFEGGMGVRWTHFETVGERMICHRRIESDKLAVPLEWDVAYRSAE